MAWIVSGALAQVKREWKSLLSAERIVAACRATGHTWRERKFGPVETVSLFMLQVLHGNTALTHLSHLWGTVVNASAFCEARQRLPLAVWQWLLESVGAELRSSTETLWHGLRLWVADGSSFSMPDTPELARHFGYPSHQKRGCGFPVAHLLMLMDVATGLCRRAHALPLNQNDLPHMPAVHALLEPGDVLLGDRGFCSYGHLAVLHRQGLHGVFRVHSSQRVDFTPGRPRESCRIRPRKRKSGKHRPARRRPPRNRWPTSQWLRSLGPDDQLVAWFKPSECPDWLSPSEYAALPEQLSVRELRYTVAQPGFRTRTVVLVTTLLDEKTFPAVELRDLYRQRWQIETSFRHLKTTMGLEVLKCHTVEGVCKELAVFVLIYNLVRAVMQVAAHTLDVPAEQISFIDTLRWLAAGGRVPLTQLIVNPHRPNRYQPRVRKRRPKPYPLMTRPRHVLQRRMRNAKLK